LRRTCLFVLAVTAAAWAQDAPSWPDTYVARLQLLALEQTINAEVLASRSATLTLEHWCRDHRLATDPTIVADAVRDSAKPATPETRERLQVTAQEEVKYRKVRLRCGSRILSEADNWYVPSRLTAEMNRLLETTTAPFGKVVQPLEPYRQTSLVRVLWSPLPEGWERTASPTQGRAGAMTIPDALFEHQAVVYTRDRKPISEVHEIYQRQLLAFPPPPKP
jgi:chorismate-pyruvate lyase